MSKKKLTPALKQYLKLKEKYRDSILMFRMGDFYEMFFEDAEIASRELEIALTARSFGKGGEKAPMCGVPYHSAENYIAKLVRKGYKVAICEQLEEPKPGKKVIDRGVVRVITPGTYFEDELEDRFLMTAVHHRNRFSVAWTELSSGDFFFTTTDSNGFKSLLSKFTPKELLVPEGFPAYRAVKEISPETIVEEREKEFFKGDFHSPEVENEKEREAVNGLLNFIRETQINFIPKLKPPRKYIGEKYVYLDPQTQRNLELTEPADGRSFRATLLNVLDKTRTGMGRRLLRFWILHPLREKGEIEKRLLSVEELREKPQVLEDLRRLLSQIYDVERLLSKVTSGIATPKDLAGLRSSIKHFPKLKETLSKLHSPLLKELHGNFDDLYDIYCELERVLYENPPSTLKDGGVIKSGVDKELDELRKLKEKSESFIKEIEEREKKRTGINSLKVGFNSIFGYYIEVSKPNLHLVPKEYIRKQTLVNAERFITPELKEFEEKVLSAQERIERIEYEIFTKLRSFITERSDRITKSAEIVAAVDALHSLAKVSVERNYVKPKVTNGYRIVIEGGRHPVLESLLEEDFIPNDTLLSEDSFIQIVTGPNMGGKSVYLRQTALIVLMAQIGSFVPADSAEVGVVDRIFTRVGASDNLSRGLSTFMMEMVETANILKNATEKSLVILDEIGRGTSTYDGMSIARAVVEYISRKVKAKTLFATHYHELTELEGKIKGVKNLHVAVEEVDGKVVFTHKVLPGASEKSYGIHVAELAGLPKEVIERAREILEELERKGEVNQLPLFSQPPPAERVSPEVERIIDELLNIEISNTTPLEALVILSRLKELAKGAKLT